MASVRARPDVAEGGIGTRRVLWFHEHRGGGPTVALANQARRESDATLSDEPGNV